MKALIRVLMVMIALGLLSAVGTARVQSMTNLSPPNQVATPFPSGPADDNTTSLGSFQIVVDPAFRPLMAGYLGYDGVSVLQSPHLFDGNTVIGRSAPHLHGDATDTGGTAVGTAGTLIADSAFLLEPTGFQGPAQTREVHTEVRSLNMTPFTQPTGGEFCFGPAGLAVRAGIQAPQRPISPGEVEAQSSASDFPAESFFNVFVEVDLPAFASFPGGTLFNRDPLLVANANLDAFPPHVVYIHENSSAVAVHFKSDDPGGKWLAGDRFGWLVLAGHGVKFDCTPGSVQEFNAILQRTPPMQVVTPTIEIDRFATTQALVGIKMSPTSPVVNAILNGPATVEVDLGSLGDGNTNNLEEVDTELVRMELTASGMTLRAGRDYGLPASKGKIEEKENRQAGRLDLEGPDAPFCTPPVADDCANTQANSFFDVFFEIEVAGVGKLHNNTALRIEAVIDQKPPKTRYIHVLTQPIPLFNAKNEATGISLVTAEHNTQPPLDHFKCYNITQSDPAAVNATVSLKDQFGAAEAKVLNPFVFCNPVQKTHNNQITPIGDRDAHLKFYTIETTTDTRPRVVAVNNQFGAKQVLKVGKPLYLAVPTQKLVPGPHPSPKNLDHFKCYEVSGQPVNATVDLQDQFYTEPQVKVINPLLLCNPVQKQHAGAITPIRHPADHLVCYDIQSDHPPMTVRARNQFGDESLVVNNARLLCAPSKKTKEVDVFPNTHALVGLRMGSSGPVVNVILSGPATVEVDLTSLADVSDEAASPGAPNVPNNLEEVQTELISMMLTGNSALGVIELRAGSALLSSASPGQIEEKVNKQSGRLDLPGLDEPFCTEPVPADCAGTQANSFFDVFFEVEVAGQILHNKDPLRITAVIDQKPPRASYKHVITTPIELFKADNTSANVFLVTAQHNTQPALDHFKCYNVQNTAVNAAVYLKDQFGAADARVLDPIAFCNPVAKTHNGQVTPIEDEDAHLKFYRIETPADTRPRAVAVSNQFGDKQALKVFEPRYLAVPTQKEGHRAPQSLDHFKCYRVTGKPVDATVGLRDQFLEEPQVAVFDPVLLCNPVEKRHNNTVTPIQNPEDHLVCYRIGGTFTKTVQTDNQFGKETLVVINPLMLCAPSKKTREVDAFTTTRALVGLQLANGALVNLILGGPATVEVDLTSLVDASDAAINPAAPDAANGLEEVKTELISMTLSTNSIVGVINLRAGSALGLAASLGQIEEKVNKQSGRLDLPGLDEPFCTAPIPANCVGTSANSFFDVFFEIEVMGQILHNKEPLRIASVIKTKPPRTRYIHVITTPIELYDTNNNLTGIKLVTAEHQTVPIKVRPTPRVRAQLMLRNAQGQTETLVLYGPATTHVFLDESCTAQDTDGDGLDQVSTDSMLDLQGTSSTLGQVVLRLRNVISPTGEIEETSNPTPGKLDVRPCTGQGRVNSFFDIFVELELPATTAAGGADRLAQQGQVLHTAVPIHLETTVASDDPFEAASYQADITGSLELLDENDASSGLSLVNGVQVSNVSLFLPLIQQNLPQ